MSHRRRGRLLRAVAAASVVVVLAGAGAAGWAWWRLHRPYRAWAGEQARVTIPEGAPARTILALLERHGVIENALLARLYLRFALEDAPLKAGEYQFERPVSVPEVLAKLNRGEVVIHPVTLVEGQTLEETAGALARAGFGAEDALVAAMRSPALIADLDPRARDLEGYLFPDTYSFARGTPESEIVATLVATFRERYQKEIAPILERRTASAPPGSSPPDLRRLVTLASIVEKEARLDEERRLIAGVYVNRLRRGIALYADPTVIFALKQRGRWDGNLRRDDLQVDSPYNTYRYPGLPPGPICSPGLASLVAAADPAQVPYLYFVSRNDGSHVFSESLAEHNRNVEIWQRRYWRKRWAEERRKGTDGPSGGPGGPR